MPAQVMANNSMQFDTLAKHSSVNSKNYAVMLSILVKEFEYMFQDCQSKNINCFVYMQLYFHST